ncbi:MAG: translation initiation factor [Nitrospira sp.]
MKERKRIPTDGEPVARKSPFAALQHVELPPAVQSDLAAPDARPAAAANPARKQKHRGRVDILRQTAHRGGKTVTVVTGFVGISQAEKEQLAKAMQRACGTGGTVKEGRIEIQGDRRADIARILAEAGFRPVFAGG